MFFETRQVRRLLETRYGVDGAGADMNCEESV